MRIRWILLAVPLAIQLVAVTPAFAGWTWNDRDVMTRPCPFSCNTLGLSERHCKDWSHGDTCYVRDMRASHNPRSLSRSERCARDYRAGLRRDHDGYLEYDKTPSIEGERLEYRDERPHHWWRW